MQSEQSVQALRGVPMPRVCVAVAGGEAGERYLDVGERSDLVMGTLHYQNDTNTGLLTWFLAFVLKGWA